MGDLAKNGADAIATWKDLPLFPSPEAPKKRTHNSAPRALVRGPHDHVPGGLGTKGKVCTIVVKQVADDVQLSDLVSAIH